MEPGAQVDTLSFGPFTLVPRERLLTRDGTPLQLGTRALDILIALVSHANQPLDKAELIAQVWPDATVGEGSLRFHMTSLRKALGDGENGTRYITTLAGRGYCFVAPVSRSNQRVGEDAACGVSGANMPSRLIRMVGRANGVLMITTLLAASRFVTIVGAGGVGKTTVAIEVGHDQIAEFAGAVLFVDLGAMSDPKLAATSLASMLGLSVQSEDPIPSLIAYLRDKRVLLIFDNCEHLIGGVAALAARIFAATPQVHILATSREPLRVEGEHVYRLAPLAFPPDDPGLTVAAALTFPAVQLFVERAGASGAQLDLDDMDAAVVASICRKLDGVPLAIELAAGRVEAYGLEQTAALLEERLSLLWLGQRTAPPRQQTLKATLDWSYGLLSDSERQVLRQSTVFVGDFTLRAALAVLTSATTDQILVLGAIESLVAKSMVATNRMGAAMRYRLLETTRAYAREMQGDDAESAALSARHATYYWQWLEQNEGERSTLSSAAERAPHLAELGNVRAALERCFGDHVNAEIGVRLASAATHFFLTMSLLNESHRWAERAILALSDATRADREEMRLQAALGLSLMFTRGTVERARAALNRSLAVAEEIGDASTQLQLLSLLHMFHGRVGDSDTALHYARRMSAVAGIVADPVALALAHALLGMSLHRMGDLAGARVEFEGAVRHERGSRRTATTYLGFDGHNLAGSGLAKTLWMQGYPLQAAERARQTVVDAAGAAHPVTLSVALIWAITVFFWIGDLHSAEEHIAWFISRAETHSLGPYRAVGRGFNGELAVHRGDAGTGVEKLQSCLKELHEARYELLTIQFNIALVAGLAATGRFGEGLTLIDETIRLIERNGDFSYMPEVQRVKGSVLVAMPRPRVDEAATCFAQSIELSRRQGALAWELRTAIDLAGLLAAQQLTEPAREVLQPVFDQFVEGFDTADLQAAERLFTRLGVPARSGRSGATG
jgi:predicted ATPase/DNA-binding winged helix-turn-helix (wHTH) protein